MSGRGWEHFPHGADVGILGFGPTREAAFEEGAMALTAIVTDPAGVKRGEKVQVRCEAPDNELLFVEWLNSLIYEMATRNMLFGRFEVSIGSGELSGSAWGEPVDVARHQPAAEPKGATLTALSVEKSEDGTWSAQCVVDV